VDITLSTGNPSVNNNKPVVRPWILQYYDASNRAGNYLKAPPVPSQLNEVQVKQDKKGKAREDDFEVESTSIANFTQVTEAGVNTEFKISVPYSVASDGSASTIEIQNHQLPSGYKYYAAPKYTNNAFLLADVTGWDNLNLLPGESSIFFEGTYVGKSFIDPNTTEDTLQLSLGVDKGIVVERKKVNEQCKKVTIGSSRKTTTAYEISVRNTKNKEIEMVIEDQIPISRLKEIEVNLDSKTGNPEYNAETGVLKWRTKVAPGETVKFNFTYSVKHPKDKVISNL
jgi:uncharacterized protein (TIGR02231 family)